MGSPVAYLWDTGSWFLLWLISRTPDHGFSCGLSLGCRIMVSPVSYLWDAGSWVLLWLNSGTPVIIHYLMIGLLDLTQYAQSSLKHCIFNFLCLSTAPVDALTPAKKGDHATDDVVPERYQPNVINLERRPILITDDMTTTGLGGQILVLRQALLDQGRTYIIRVVVKHRGKLWWIHIPLGHQGVVW